MYIDVPRGEVPFLEVAMTSEDHLLKGKTFRTLYVSLKAEILGHKINKDLVIPSLVTSIKFPTKDE